jgi:16S rRNA processing protein RimM
MNFISIGKYVNTHGVKGEIRIISDFSRKDLIFMPGFIIYIGKERQEFTINTYRKHKNYDMVTLKDINDINDIEHLKGSTVYINKDDINISLEEDYIDYKVIIDDVEYNIKEIIKNKKNKIIVLDNKSMIPLVDEFIIKVDSNGKKIYIKNMKGLIL